MSNRDEAKAAWRLQQMLREVVPVTTQLHVEHDQLRLMIQRLLRHRFGRRCEQLTEDQLQFGLEDLEQRAAENQTRQEDAAAANAEPERRATRC